jgi:hypothetical protein
MKEVTVLSRLESQSRDRDLRQLGHQEADLRFAAVTMCRAVRRSVNRNHQRDARL